MNSSGGERVKGLFELIGASMCWVGALSHRCIFLQGLLDALEHVAEVPIRALQLSTTSTLS